MVRRRGDVVQSRAGLVCLTGQACSMEVLVCLACLGPFLAFVGCRLVCTVVQVGGRFGLLQLIDGWATL